MATINTTAAQSPLGSGGSGGNRRRGPKPTLLPTGLGVPALILVGVFLMVCEEGLSLATAADASVVGGRCAFGAVVIAAAACFATGADTEEGNNFHQRHQKNEEGFHVRVGSGRKLLTTSSGAISASSAAGAGPTPVPVPELTFDDDFESTVDPVAGDDDDAFAVGEATSPPSASPATSEPTLATAQPTVEPSLAVATTVEPTAAAAVAPTAAPVTTPVPTAPETPAPTDQEAATRTAPPVESPPPVAPTDDEATATTDDETPAPTTPEEDEENPVDTPAPTPAVLDEEGEGVPTPTPTPAGAVETLAPIPEGAVAQLTGSVSAPSSVLSGPPSANILEQALKSLMELEDQDKINVSITEIGTGRRRNLLGDGAEGLPTDSSVHLLRGGALGGDTIGRFLAEELGTSADEVVIDDVVFSSTTAEDIDTEDAAATFADDPGSASGAAVAVAVALILAAVCVTGCLGLACGKCWLNKQRAKAAANKEKAEEERLKLQPAYEYPHGGGGLQGATSASNESEGAALRNGTNNGTGVALNAFGRLAPAVSVGGNPLDRGAQSSGFSYDLENEGGTEDLVEHNYGDTGVQAESFVDGMDGTYSEFGGNQSAYSDSVVPGGDANDGVMSERSSARFYDDDGEETSEWGGTDLTGAAMGDSILAEFPLRKGMSIGMGGSSRFSAGPRSQASFAANSVAASGRSVQSSVAHGAPSTISSRSNFPPRGGISPPYSLGGDGGGSGGASPLRGVMAGKGLVDVEGVMRGGPPDAEVEVVKVAGEPEATTGTATVAASAAATAAVAAGAAAAAAGIAASSSSPTAAASPDSSSAAPQQTPPDGDTRDVEGSGTAASRISEGSVSAASPAGGVEGAASTSPATVAATVAKEAGGSSAKREGQEGGNGGGGDKEGGTIGAAAIAAAAAAERTGTRHVRRSSGGGGGTMGRASLDSAAGSMAGLNLNRVSASPPESIVGIGGSWKGAIGRPTGDGIAIAEVGDKEGVGGGGDRGSKPSTAMLPPAAPAGRATASGAAGSTHGGSGSDGNAAGRPSVGSSIAAAAAAVGTGGSGGVNDDDAASQWDAGSRRSGISGRSVGTAAARSGAGGINDDDAASQWDAGSRRSGVSGRSVGTAAARSGAGGINDDDAASYYAGGSSAAGGGGGRGASGQTPRSALGGIHSQSWRRVVTNQIGDEDEDGGAGGGGAEGVAVRQARRSGGPSGRNSQSMGGMTVDSSHPDSDRESFVSRVGSYALTDVGVGTSELAGRRASAGGDTGSAGAGAAGGAGGVLSPTSTVMRSIQGMSEMGTERDSYGSDVYTNGSDSPGAQSGWERAWMRQRDDARHFGGGPQQG
eukprot:g11167.t1